jgi:phosphopantetheinyl transferase
MAIVDRGEILVIILEHEISMPDSWLERLLDWRPDDLARMAAFRSQAAKTSWCMSRRLFSDAMADIAGIEGAPWKLGRGGCGKPFIEGCGIKFNWSHAEGCVALALSAHADPGVDIECASQGLDGYMDIARAYFGQEEIEWIGADAGPSAWERFLSLYVQKEAWLKALGCGLSQPLSETPAVLQLPPHTGGGRMLIEPKGKNRYFLAAAASPHEAGLEPRFSVERR